MTSSKFIGPSFTAATAMIVSTYLRGFPLQTSAASFSFPNLGLFLNPQDLTKLQLLYRRRVNVQGTTIKPRVLCCA